MGRIVKPEENIFFSQRRTHMTKTDFVRRIRTETTKATLTQEAATEIADLVFDTIKTVIKDEQSFRFPGFGTFNLKNRPARTGRNPQTGKPIKIKESHTVTFRPASKLKEDVTPAPSKRKKVAKKKSS
jgi:nucleoid DNA-binding protein